MYRIILLSLLTVYAANAQQIILFPEKPTVVIGERVSILIDSTHSLAISDFLDPLRRFNFSSNATEVINLGFTKNPVWLKFELYSTSTVQWYLEIANPLLEEIELFQVKDNLMVDYHKVGFMVSFSSRPIKFRNPIIPFFLSEGENKTFYIKVRSSNIVSIPLRIGSDKAIINSIHYSDIFYTFGFGAILMMLFYNLIIYFGTRNSTYLLYCIYLISAILINGHYLGVNFEFLWPEFPRLNYYGNSVFTTFFGTMILFFCVDFLQLRIYFPKWYRYIFLLLLIPLLSIIFLLLGDSTRSISIVRIGSIVFMIAMLFCAFLVYRRGYLPARAFIVAFMTFLVFSVVFIFRYHGVYFYTLMANSALQVGTVAQMALLSIALSDRINLYKKQNEAAQKEKELFILEQNRMLEAKVAERTQLLEEANKDLMNSQKYLLQNATLISKTNKNLEQTQKSLIEKEERLVEAQRLAKLASYQIEIETERIFYSETIYEVLDIDPSTPISLDMFKNLTLADDYNSIVEQKKRAFEQRKNYTVVFRILGASGQINWIQEIGHPVFDDSGAMTKLSVTLQNITESKKSDEKIAETYRLLKIQNDNITDSIRYAKRIQSAILPDENELVKSFGESFVLYMPKDIVSGDFYWFKKYNKGESKIILAAGDCTGHGVPGALMSIVSYNLLRETVELKKIHQPAAILEDLRIGIRTTLKQDENKNRDGLDVSLCLLDLQKNTLSFAGSYTPMYYFLPNSGQIQSIKPNKLSIGGNEITLNQAFEQVEMPLVDKMVVYLFSDGYQDQFGGEMGNKFMAKRFRELLTEIHKKPLSKQKQILESRIKNWMGSFKQIDDIMVIGLKINLSVLKA